MSGVAVDASRSRWRQGWRVAGYAAAAGIAFVVLEQIELALLDLVGADTLLASTQSEGADERLAAEADALAARSQARMASLPSGHRSAAFRLGYELGWASEFVGSFAMSDPGIQARATAQRIGIDDGIVAALPSRTLTDFARVQERFERDESGIAARVEAQLTPVHRELYLFGVSVGADAAMVESSSGKLAEPSVERIRRHATLAGIESAAWQPLVADSRGVPPDVVVARHRTAVEAILSTLAARDADDAARR